MSAKAFIDTNIFVYSFDDTAPEKAAIAWDLIRELAATQSGAISFQVVEEFFAVALKHFPAAMRPEGAVRYLNAVFRPLLAVHSSVSLYSEALNIQDRYRLSWYDSLIVSAASEAHCSVIYSEDFQHGSKINGIRIQNPFIA